MNQWLKQRRFNRILLIKPSSLGDIVHALPVLAGLRRRYPRAHIAWLVASPYASLLRAQSRLDEVILFDRRRYGMLGRSFRVSVTFADFLHRLWVRHFDLAIDLQGLFRSGFLALASGANVRLGFADAREFGWFFYTHRVAVPTGEVHAIRRNYLLAGALGLEQPPAEPGLQIPAAAHDRAAALLRAAGLAQAAGYAVLLPASRWQTKRWPPDYFAQLAERIYQQIGLAVVLLGATSETSLCCQVQRRAASRIINLAGQTSLPVLTAVLSRAHLVVSSDSGPMHLAAALRRPLLALFGPTSPARTGPYWPNGRVVRRHLPCSPCFLRWISQCPHHHRCLRELTVAEVFEQVRRLVADHPVLQGRSAG